ncbi:MAG: hypothetical protein WBE21_05335 [Candidatus Acidiferrales bacterium]|jgi:hypothetical protein|nr:hypothetical protein [Candidatus Acidoferrales bacterium]
MNVTRNVVTDLLPVYFAGEASGDTKVLVEDYFRQDPDFERVARSAATPLEALRRTARVTPDAEREKRDLECVRRGLWRNKVFFGLALFNTLAPLAFFFSKGHFFWLVREDPWEAAFFWSIAAILWLAYFGRLTRRAASLLFAILFILAPIVLDLHFSFAGGLHFRDKNSLGLLWEAVLFWSVAAMLLIQYFARLRRRTAQTVFAILLTVLPLPFVLHAVFAGGPYIASNVAGPAVLWLFAAWLWVMRSRQRSKADSDKEC